jgi:BirA family biotin operon repressor/biotin-[acetyl-CoA-carboxylase] ligase
VVNADLSSPYAELDRPPLSETALRLALLGTGADGRPSGWTDLRVVASTGSTNADLMAAAEEGAPGGTVLIADHQAAGRGRRGRSWTNPPRASLSVSVLLRPVGVPTSRWAWLMPLAGVSLVRVVRRLGQIDAVLKWPNDLMLGPDRHKAAGILAEIPTRGGPGVVIGMGVNVSTTRAELPREDSTSLMLEGAACTDRDPLVRALLRQLSADYQQWAAAGGDPRRSGLRDAYVECCDTLGRQVTVTQPNNQALVGEAVEVNADGQLIILTEANESIAVTAGDVIHLRDAAEPA